MTAITITSVSELVATATCEGRPVVRAIEDYPREHPVAARNMLAVVARRGIRTPITFGQDGQIAPDAVGQLWAAEALGLAEVPVARP